MRAFETEKTDVAEVDRSIYDIKDAANAAFEVNFRGKARPGVDAWVPPEEP